MNGTITHPIRAAGAVLWRGTPEGVELALVHRPRYDDWSFPKGKLDRGESMAAAAVREVEEETGQRCRLGPALGDVHYTVPEGHKLVRYWAGEALGGEFEPNSETNELRWVSPAAAAQLLTYQHDHGVLRRFTDIGPPTAVVLLVRHAKAGNRLQWDGDDDLRPLSGTGREQARHLAATLPLFGPDRIITAPPVRCRDSVGPLAEHLGLTPAEEPLFGEEGYWVDPPAGLARLLDVATKPGVTVVSSQGGVIPDVVAELIETSPRPLGIDTDDVPSKKASTWVLSFADGVLRAADYRAFPGD